VILFISEDPLLTTKRILKFALLLFAFEAYMTAAPPTQVCSDSGANSVVASVDGATVTLADFEHERPFGLFQAQNAFYQTEKKAVDEYLDDYLLERQAQKENVTVPELLKVHVDSTIAKDPGDDALRVYYEGLDSAEPFETMRGKILDHIHERRLAKAKLAYIQTLRSQSQITLQLPAPRVQVSLDKTQVRGAEGAPVTLVEFADFECPYCQQFEPTLDRLRADFKDKLAFAYKDVPLPMHGHAEKAAEAAHCAGTQNKYWEYHDLLLKTKELEIPQLKAEAQNLGLDTTAFNKCLDSGEQADTIKATLEEARQLGITGTPSFLLNGRYFSGVMSYDQLHSLVAEELKTLENQPQRAAR
jgi:protein-disulfide isomerase